MQDIVEMLLRGQIVYLSDLDPVAYPFELQAQEKHKSKQTLENQHKEDKEYNTQETPNIEWAQAHNRNTGNTTKKKL